MSDFRIVAESDRQIVVTRSFAASVDRVIAAFMEPDLLRRWMGSPDMPMDICEVDPRVGGGFRYSWTFKDGRVMWLKGTFREMTDNRVVHTEVFEPDWTGGQTEVVTDFIAKGGRTEVQTTITYSGTPARDAAFASGMASGMSGAYDRLDEAMDAG
jgi:uncharacterized protein YndB with AHSA1/START domain